MNRIYDKVTYETDIVTGKEIIKGWIGKIYEVVAESKLISPVKNKPL